MMKAPHPTCRRISALALLALLGACASPTYRAPVEDRASPARAAAPAPATAVASMPADPNKPAPGAENLGKPGYYAVKPGDTLFRIALEAGQNWRDVQRWNNLDNPNAIEVGQVLRVVPPGTDAAAAAPRPVPNAVAKVEARPLDAKAGAPASSAPASAATAPGAAAQATSMAPAPAAGTATPREADDEISWGWPAAGAVVTPFDEARSKGLVFAGKAGDPVVAAADGRVIYAGSGLRGYGNMVIVKHNNSYLTAYAHNQILLVKEDQVVRKGQRIAEMGSSDAERVQLHFEIRRLGKPIDPARLLPPR
ncbi:MAG: peptidoglycan DD-metalloendopeptidase family protein [Aquincola sp.]|nr:peptidoglycan DD-metalloendopeptidase family protein [Aquincola sp.]